VALAGSGPAADEFRRIARLIIDEVAPPTNMAGCSARMLDMVAAALDAADRP
jgi:ATP-binding protein involved in chromosome partitioning